MSMTGFQLILGRSQNQVAAACKHDIKVELVGQVIPNFDTLCEESDPLLGSKGRTNHFSVSAACAAADIAFIQHNDVGHAAEGKIVGKGQSLNASSHNDDFIIFSQLIVRPLLAPATLAELAFQVGAYSMSKNQKMFCFSTHGKKIFGSAALLKNDLTEYRF
jgi:hypothetical protein